MKNRKNAVRSLSVAIVRLFDDGIAFSFWHYFGKPHGTAIRWTRNKPGLFGIHVRDSGIHIGLWWQVRLELIAVHPAQFLTNARDHESPDHGGDSK